MSILDGMPSSKEDLTKAVEFAVPMVQKAMAKMKLTERKRSIMELMQEGLSLADILRITKEERDALFVHGLRFIQVGDVQKARDVLLSLYQLEPLDERVIYALATTFQLQGDLATAGKLYVHFLALDATNPEGHLRLGECFLGAKEFENAESSFKTAQRLAQGTGDTNSVEHAVKMLGVTQERAAAAA